MQRAGGFSLIEVVIAIGIFSFAAVAMIGLLAVSLTSEEASSSDTAMATMTQTAMSSLRGDTFSQLTTANGTAMYFDVRGTRLVDSVGNDLTLTTAKAAGAIYQCTIATASVQPVNSSNTASATVLMSVVLNFSWPVIAATPSNHKTICTCLADYE